MENEVKKKQLEIYSNNTDNDDNYINPFVVEDLILLLKQLENNKHIPTVKILSLFKDEIVENILINIVVLVGETLITADGRINSNAINKVIESGFNIFSLDSNEVGDWKNMIICTKKGQIHI
jgi:hypothetical protein